MKLLYFTMECYDVVTAQTSGVLKKIFGQMAALTNLGIEVEYIVRIDGFVYLVTGDSKHKLCASSGTAYFDFKNVAKGLRPYIDGKRWDVVYVRYCGTNGSNLAIYRRCKQQGMQVVLEIPTYPFKQELGRSVKGRLIYLLNQIYNSQLKRYVQSIVTYNDVEFIYGIQTIKISNGVKVEDYRLGRYRNSETLNLIMLGTLEKWHGYDRILAGLAEYYKKEKEKEKENGAAREKVIKLHIVGTGVEMDNYRTFVNEHQLTPYVTFHGIKGGDELDAIFAESDLGINSIGCHRKGVTELSTLKSREFMARGLPFVYSAKDTVLKGDEFFALKIPEDDSTVDMEQLIGFHEGLGQRKDITESIRQFAKEQVSWEGQMKKVLDNIQKTKAR